MEKKRKAEDKRKRRNERKAQAAESPVTDDPAVSAEMNPEQPDEE